MIENYEAMRAEGTISVVVCNPKEWVSVKTSDGITLINMTEIYNEKNSLLAKLKEIDAFLADVDKLTV